jgi:hypothetical protein
VNNLEEMLQGRKFDMPYDIESPKLALKISSSTTLFTLPTAITEHNGDDGV